MFKLLKKIWFIINYMVINNEKNRRILYSKSIAALYANGKYILELD